jgi:hypothetical protein
MRILFTLSILLTACAPCAPCLRSSPLEAPPPLRLQEPHVITDRLHPFTTFARAVDCRVLLEADRAVRDFDVQERRRIDQQIKEWNAEIQLNELQDQIDTLGTP